MKKRPYALFGLFFITTDFKKYKFNKKEKTPEKGFYGND